MAKLWQRSINKESWSEAEPFYGQTPLAGSVGEGKRRKETCVRGRGKSPVHRRLLTQRQTPSLLPAEPDLPKPITQMEKEEKTSKIIVIIMVIRLFLKFAQLIICSS